MQDQTKLFLARVLAWPQDGDPVSYGNIHHTFTPHDGVKADRAGKPHYPLAGHAYRDAGSAAKAAIWALTNASTRDIYFCTSMQRYAQTVISKKGKPYLKGHRSQDQVAKMKALFIDIDMTEGKADKSKGYDSMKELVGGLGNFLNATGLPKPTFMVNSGGGLHVYWTLMTPLTL